MPGSRIILGYASVGHQSSRSVATCPSQETRANDLSDDLPLSVVGRNLSTNHAAIWIHDAGNWTYEDLNEVSRFCGPNFTLISAEDVVDINGEVQIVGWGGQDPDGRLRAFTLVPLGNCTADLNYDGVVNVADLIIVINDWGCSQSGARCCGDVNLDGVVNVTDLIEVQNLQWNCTEGGAAASGTAPFETVVEAVGLGYPEDWDLFVAAMASNSSLATTASDNFACWMLHYLTECQGESCSYSGCPGPDPFGTGRH